MKMAKMVVDNWAKVPIDLIANRREIEEALTLRIRGYSPNPNVPAPVDTIRLYARTPEYLAVPRSYGLERFLPDLSVEDKTTEGYTEGWAGPVGVANGMAPRPEQEKLLNAVEEKFRSPIFYGGIIQAPTGFGKTAVASFLISRLEIPTLVIVHKQFLLDQWIDRLNTFLDNPKIGVVRQDRCEYMNRHVVVAMIQSLAQREYPKSFYRWPGLVITDETHRVAAKTWVQTITQFSPRYRLGLTATPRRADNAEKAFFYHIGPIIYRAEQRRLIPKVKRVWTGFTPKGRAVYVCKGSNKNLILRFVCADGKRNSIIVSQIVRAYKAGRKSLVLSDRVQHLKNLKELLDSAWRAEEGKAPVTALYIGSTKKADREEAVKADVIFATKQLVSEGFDVPELDTLFLTTPISDAEQAVGRILRDHPDKKDPIVVDFRDDAIPLFKRMAEKRDSFYSYACRPRKNT